MGNRAVIAYESMPQIGIYVHWNGGPESVLAFLEDAKSFGRAPGGNSTYSFASLLYSITGYLGKGGCSVGVGPLNKLDCDNYDNGLYWIGDDWTITRREHTKDTAISLDTLPKDQVERYEGILAEVKEQRTLDTDKE